MARTLEKKVGIYSVSRLSSKQENDLIEAAVKNTFMVVSGVGAPRDAHVINALLETDLMKRDDIHNVAGEFLYHPYTLEHCAQKFEERTHWFDVKEWLFDPPGVTPNPPASSSPLLASLFGFNNLKNISQPNRFRSDWPRAIVAFVNCNDGNRSEKATSLLQLLRNGFLTHLCIPFDLAQSLKQHVA